MASETSTTLEYLLWLYLKGAHSYQLFISARSLYSSYIAVVNLRKHEKESEKAAELSQTTADQLFKIRTTQASGVIAGIISLVSSAYLLSSSSIASDGRISPHLLISATNIIIITIAARYISDFWSSSLRIPFIKSYNEALQHTDAVTSSLHSASFAWVLSVPLFIRGFFSTT